MKSLITILQTELNGAEINSVNARELHEFLGSKRDFSTWIKDRLEYVEALENTDFIRFHKKVEANNATQIEYIITLDLAKEFAMIERNDKGKQARRYFIEVEKAYKEQNANLSEIDILINTAKLLKEQQKRVKAVELKTDGIQKEHLRLKSNISRILTNDNYMTVIAYANLKGIKATDYHAPSIGKKAKRLSEELSIPMGAVIDPRFGKVNTYDVNILAQILQ